MKINFSLLIILFLNTQLLLSQTGVQELSDTLTISSSSIGRLEYKLDPIAIMKLRLLEQNVKDAASNPQKSEKSVKEFEAAAGQFPMEMKFIKEQREQEEASKELTSEEYDKWKKEKHSIKPKQ